VLYNMCISLARSLYLSILCRESSGCFFLLDLAFGSLGLDGVLGCTGLVLGLAVGVCTVSSLALGVLLGKLLFWV
jgi:hypothetical protein